MQMYTRKVLRTLWTLKSLPLDIEYRKYTETIDCIWLHTQRWVVYNLLNLHWIFHGVSFIKLQSLKLKIIPVGINSKELAELKLSFYLCTSKMSREGANLFSGNKIMYNWWEISLVRNSNFVQFSIHSFFENGSEALNGLQIYQRKCYLHVLLYTMIFI